MHVVGLILAAAMATAAPHSAMHGHSMMTKSHAMTSGTHAMQAHKMKGHMMQQHHMAKPTTN